jgi:hypothetical protein
MQHENGLDNLVWFLGVVEDRNDPTNHGRVRVRAFGFHPPLNTNEVLTEDLPWAFLINGTGGSFFSIPEEGDWVFGFFMDGRDAQHPFVLGVIHGAHYGIPYDGAVGYGAGQVDPPLARAAAQAELGNDGGTTGQLSRAALENDPAWQAQLAAMKAKYPGLDENQLYRIIQGESGFNSQARNGSTDASGLFQFIPSTARELGYTTEQIRAMSPADQLRVYDRYLSNAGYRGGYIGGILQAAPGWNRANPSASDSAVVYVRTREDLARYPGAVFIPNVYTQNPGWVGSNGLVTKGSINAYYDRQRGR